MKSKLSPKEAIVIRSKLLRLTQEFYSQAGYLEVDTPNLVVCPGTEIHLEYFNTSWRNHNAEEKKLYLRSSPELHMKKAVASLQSSVFQISNAFRNKGEWADWHYPEFKMLEAYKVDTSLSGYLDELYRYIAKVHNAGRSLLNKPEKELPPAFKVSMFEAFKAFTGIELIDQDPGLAKKAVDFPYISPSDDFETSYFKLLLNEVEPALAEKEIAIVSGYPPSQAALSQIQAGVAERFEVYLNGIEIANGFVELRGSKKNLNAIVESNKERVLNGKDALPIDEDFIKACDHIPAGTIGVALGLDRLMAISLELEGVKDIMPLYDFLDDQ